MIDLQALKNKPKGLFFSDRAPSLVKKLTRLYANKYKISIDFFLCIVYTISTKGKRGKQK